MKRIHSARRAIFVFESPWEMDAGDSNRTSVLPFIEGIGKLSGDVEVFHANFYDESSFKKALKCLAKTRYENAVVYIAAHGSATDIGGVKTHALLWEVGEIAKSLNITGVLLGACLAGGNTSQMEAYTEGSNLRWCAGYSSSVSWLEGTFIDCAILSRMLELDDEDSDFKDVDLMVEAIAEAIAPFSKSYGIGTKKKTVLRLDQSIEFVVQAKGKGNVAKTVTTEVFAAWDSNQN
jgi:hypothetical protein